MINEGPSPEDLERFSDESGHCPECGASIWDQADICPKCFSYLAGHTSSYHPVTRVFAQKWRVIIVLLVVVAFLMMLLPGGSQLLRVFFPASP